MRLIAGQFLRFTAVGAVATAVHYVILIALAELAGVDPVIGTVCGYGVGAVVSYSLHRVFTFGVRPAYARGFVKFLAVIGVGAVINTAIVAFLIAHGQHYLIAQVIATALVLVWNFTASRLVVFRA